MTEETIAAPVAQPTRSPLAILGWAAPLAGLVVAIVFLTQTTWYEVFKTIHVVAAITWLGGGLLITVLALRADRTGNDDELIGIGRQAEWASTRIFIPSALVVLVMGLVLMHKGQWGYDHFWTLFGLLAWGLSFVIGDLPRAADDEAQQARRREGPSASRDAGEAAGDPRRRTRGCRTDRPDRDRHGREAVPDLIQPCGRAGSPSARRPIARARG
jgi:uncharacterized membrane protein